jgi:hypothetical protein
MVTCLATRKVSDTFAMRGLAIPGVNIERCSPSGVRFFSRSADCRKKGRCGLAQGAANVKSDTSEVVLLDAIAEFPEYFEKREGGVLATVLALRHDCKRVVYVGVVDRALSEEEQPRERLISGLGN